MTVSSHGLNKKRKKALYALLGGAASTGVASGTPTPGLEAPKQAAIAIGDVAIMAGIYNIYYDDDIDVGGVKDMLVEAGLVAAVGGGLAYGGVKVTEAILAEILNWVPVVGWVTSGAITASVTLTVGALWWWRCDNALRRGTTPVNVIKQAFA
jgi:hypothetical protein